MTINTQALAVAQNYSSLNHINNDSFKEYIKSPTILEVGKILKKHSLNDKYCLHLLHSHYKIKSTEVIFKKIYKTKIVTNVISVDKIPSPAEELIVSPTIFKFEGGRVEPLEIGFLPKKFKFEESDYLAFSEIEDLLSKEGLSNIFGLGFRHSLYDVVNDKKTFLEATYNDRSQTMTLVTEKTAYSDKYKAIPTCWIFNSGADGAVASACPYSCASDPNGEHGHGSEHTGESV